MKNKSKVILAAIGSVGYTYSRVAKELGYSVPYIRAVAIGERKNKKIESFLKELMSQRLSDL